MLTNTKLIGFLVRSVALIAVLGFAVFASYQWGKNACQAAYEKANAKIRGEHSENVDDANRRATDRALDSQEKDLTNDQIVDEISDLARSAEGADSQCVDADIVERLRQLQ